MTLFESEEHVERVVIDGQGCLYFELSLEDVDSRTSSGVNGNKGKSFDWVDNDVTEVDDDDATL